MNEQILNQIVEVIQTHGGETLKGYTLWTIINSLSFIVGGIALIIAACKIEYQEDVVFIKYLAIFFACILIVVHIPDLLAPKAKATHYLINDIRGE